MTTFDPKALLSKPMDDIKAPIPAVLGSYVAQGYDYEFDKTKPKDGKEPTNTVKLKFRLVEAFPDVPQDELAAYLETAGKSLHEIDQRDKDFFLTENALFRLKEFLEEHCKIKADNIAEALEAYKAGAQFGATMGQVPNQKEPSRPYHQVTATFALPEGD